MRVDVLAAEWALTFVLEPLLDALSVEVVANVAREDHHVVGRLVPNHADDTLGRRLGLQLTKLLVHERRFIDQILHGLLRFFR